MKKQLSFMVLLLIVLVSNTIYSQWAVDPTVNNPICTQASTQEYPAITGDGSGGAIITWDDYRDGNWNIYAQKINSSAAVQWTTDGVAVCTQASGQNYPSITSDGSGGAIITWADGRGGTTIYAQRIDETGAPQWTTAAAGGVAISTLLSSWAPTIISDGGGGAIITWYSWSGTSNDIYAQRINASGVVQWTANGLAVCTQASHQYYPTITSDGSSGAIITWYDDRTSNQDIYAQRINSSGAVLWTADGVGVCTNSSRQDNPTITSDGSGGAIIAWYDWRSNTDIYAQRINSNGVAQWTADGLAVCTLTSYQSNPEITSDGSGGAIITWMDARNSTYYDIYAQRINSNGAAQWAADGIAISTVGGKAQLPVITGDASGGIITWQDSRNANGDIYASKASPDGVLPVELTTFTAELDGNIVELSWQTATEVNNFGFEILRSAQNDSQEYWEKIGFVQGHGNSNSTKEYFFTDTLLDGTKFQYRLKQIDFNGAYEYSDVLNVNLITPNQNELRQNSPNPFNPSTAIKFNLAQNSDVNITIYDILGNTVATLINQNSKAGYHIVYWNGKNVNGNNVSSGVYLYTLTAGSFSITKKMLLLK